MIIHPCSEIICRLSLLATERRDIKGVNRIGIDFRLRSVDDRVIAV